MTQVRMVILVNNTSNFYESLGLTISGIRYELSVGKNVIRVLSQPEYICFRVNPKKDSIIIFPCDYSDPMSYKVPDGLLRAEHKILRIYSKAFVQETLAANNLCTDSTYTMYGRYYPKQNLVRFDFQDAFENRMKLDS